MRQNKQWRRGYKKSKRIKNLTSVGEEYFNGKTDKADSFLMTKHFSSHNQHEAHTAYGLLIYSISNHQVITYSE